ncbi:TIGR00282 family metallophosphoesterase [bacterium]|nr:MAG: TIGR00282 family metallophosphoesterase [bacterium]
MNVLLIGDITGAPGRNILKEQLKNIQKQESIGFTIANAENAAGGSGVTENIANELFSYGIDVLTSGDHIWKKKETAEYIAREYRLLRPANYPDIAPGFGCYVFKTRTGESIGVINLIGRVFMQAVDCPFRKAMECVEKLRKETNTIFVDIHAEATSEKVAMGWFLDGMVSCVFGTHTHIQTADERLLYKHTAYITDIGMTGPMDSVIGRKKEQILERFLSQMPVKFEMAEADVRIHGAVVEVDLKTGYALSIERLLT